MNKTLWTIQILLAGLFLFAGGFKLLTPIEEMVKQLPVALSGGFLQFIAVCEVLGGLGLILPGLLRIKPVLTPLAGAGARDHHDWRDGDQPEGAQSGDSLVPLRNRSSCSVCRLRPLEARPHPGAGLTFPLLVQQHVDGVFHRTRQSDLARVDEEDLIHVVDRVQAMRDDHLRRSRRQLIEDLL